MAEDISGYVDPSTLSMEDITPEMLEQLKAMGVIPEEMTLLDAQLQQANLLRNAAGPEGLDSGRVYTAANPMEHIGGLMQKYNANKEARGIEDRQRGMIDILRKGRNVPMDSMYAAGLRRRKAGMTPDPFDSYSTQDY